MGKYSFLEEYIVANDLDEDLKPIEIKVPDIPNDNRIINYGSPLSKQKYHPLDWPDRMKMVVNQAIKLHRSDPKKFPIINDEINRELIKNKHKYEDVHRYILGQWERRTYGAWYFIREKRVWIPPQMTYWLDAWKLDTGLPDFRMKDRKYFGLWWQVINTEDCYGMAEVTRRKDGKSVRAACLLNEMVSRFERAHGGIQSKNDDDAEDFFKLHVVNGFKGLPFYYQPIHQHNSRDPKEQMIYGSGLADSGLAMELNAHIDYRAAKPLAYDSTFLKCYVSDEEGKLELYDAYERWEKVKPALRNHFMQVTGKSIHTTTVEDSGKYGLERFKKLFFDSLYENFGTSKNKTGLWAIFYPAYEGVVVDDYGYDNLEEGKKKVDAEIGTASRSGDSYFEKLRKNPRTLKEAFIVNAGGCRFNTDILLRRSEFFFRGNPYAETFDLEWENNKPDTRVTFHKNPAGRFKISYIPDETMRNKMVWRKNSWYPENTMLFMAGGDTFNFDKTESKGSNGGGAVYMFHNPLMEQHIQNMRPDMSPEDKEWHYLQFKTDRIVCTYSYRPENGKAGYVEDMIKMCVFFGCKMFPEHNYTHIQDGFERRGYSGFLAHKYDYRKKKLADKAGEFTNDNMKDKLFEAADSYINRNGSNEFHDDLINEFLAVTPETMTEYDLFTAASLALYGGSLLNYENDRKKKRKEKIQAAGGLSYFAEREVNLYA